MNQWRSAIDQALLLKQQPALANAFRSAALPEGMSNVIRLASDEGARREELAQLLEIDVSILQQAAAEYLLQICLYPESDYLRCLGVNQIDELKIAKEHHKLLLKWLHPDRNPANQNLAERVNHAWSVLKQNTKGLALDKVAASTPSADSLPASIPAGRFPLFLWGLVGLTALFLVLSMVPDSSIYVADVELAEADNNKSSANDTEARSDSLLEKKLSTLKLSFEEIKKSTLPDIKKIKQQEVLVAAKESKTINPSRITSKATMQTEIPLNNQRTVAVQKTDPPSQEIESQKIAPNKIENLSSLEARESSSSTIATSTAKPVMASQTASPMLLDKTQQLQIDGLFLMSEFQKKYEQGNIDAFMSIFSNTARNDNGDLQSIRQDYLRFFESSSTRLIDFSNIKCQEKANQLNCKARYKSSIKMHGDLKASNKSGQIEMFMVNHDGKLFIQQIKIKS